MHTASILLLLVAVATVPLVHSQLSGFVSVDGVGLAQYAVQTVYNLFTWQDQPMQMFGTTCVGRARSRISRWQLKWDGRFECPQLTTIVGLSTKKSMKGAVAWAAEDFVNQALAAGVQLHKE
jgi:hypothetical protein